VGGSLACTSIICPVLAALPDGAFIMGGCTAQGTSGAACRLGCLEGYAASGHPVGYVRTTHEQFFAFSSRVFSIALSAFLSRQPALTGQVTTPSGPRAFCFCVCSVASMPSDNSRMLAWRHSSVPVCVGLGNDCSSAAREPWWVGFIAFSMWVWDTDGPCSDDTDCSAGGDTAARCVSDATAAHCRCSESFTLQPAQGGLTCVSGRWAEAPANGKHGEGRRGGAIGRKRVRSTDLRTGLTFEVPDRCK